MLQAMCYKIMDRIFALFSFSARTSPLCFRGNSLQYSMPAEPTGQRGKHAFKDFLLVHLSRVTFTEYIISGARRPRSLVLDSINAAMQYVGHFVRRERCYKGLLQPYHVPWWSLG